MELFVLGTSHAVAPTGVRERLHVDPDVAYAALARFAATGLLGEAAPLATCGRLELYATAADPHRAVAALRRILARQTGLPRPHLEAHTFVHRGDAAVRHLFRVAAGLDSVVHGEAQILGQVRDVLNHPQTDRSTGPVLQRLFQAALACGKRVRTETSIGRGTASLASAALHLVRREAGDLRGRRVLVLGAGDTGALVARLLVKGGVGSLVVANRTPTRAADVAASLGSTAGVQAAGLGDLPALLAEAEIVVGAVAGVERLVTPGHLSGMHGERPRYFLDLSHPRAFDPALAELDGVHLFDLEHVAARVSEAREARAAQIPLAMAVIEEDVAVFMKWLSRRGGVPVLRAMREEVLRRARTEADRLARGRSREEQEQARRLARAVARSLLHTPTVALRDADPTSEEGKRLVESAAALFGLSDAPGE